MCRFCAADGNGASSMAAMAGYRGGDSCRRTVARTLRRAVPEQSVRRLATGHAVDLAGHEARLVRGKKHEHRRDLHRLGGARELRILAELLELLLRHGGGNQ